MSDIAHGAEPEVLVARYSGLQRLNHWLTAGLFTLLGLSGLAMFSPYLFFLTGLFGGGQVARSVHPWLGCGLFLSFLFLFIGFFRLNLLNRDDAEWAKKFGDVVSNRHDRLPLLEKYNLGQKFVFWSQSLMITVMFASGIVIWDQYFFGYTSIEAKRWAVLAHSVAAIVAIAVIFVHVYAALWVSGTTRAMIRGDVTGGWAFRHHRKWFVRQAKTKGAVHRDTHGGH